MWTKHAEERQEQWKEKRGITRNEIEDVIGNPGQVVSGHGDAEVAQKRRGPGSIRSRRAGTDSSHGVLDQRR